MYYDIEVKKQRRPVVSTAIRLRKYKKQIEEG